MSTVCAAQASSIVMPEHIRHCPNVVDFLVWHFCQIPFDVWRSRILAGKVHWQNGELVNLDTRYRARTRVFYYREVVTEPKVPFTETVLYRNESMIVAYKPHFLALAPSGHFINECLVNRLRVTTDINTIVPAHRLDRATAGLVLLCLYPEHRQQYHDLFRLGQIKKTYQALARLTPQIHQGVQNNTLTLPMSWTVKNRVVKGEPSFTMQVVEGEANSHSQITLVEVNGDTGLFVLSPITGKTHQLRLHMQSLGMPIINDSYYPVLQPKAADDYDRPMKLLAKRLQFVDPVSGLVVDVSCMDINNRNDQGHSKALVT
jgi:tRNA pseudouridine32 synthase/23S rRNA pseudouridine746 synthase